MKKKTILFMGLIAGFSLSAQNETNSQNRAPLGKAHDYPKVENVASHTRGGIAQTPSSKGKSSNVVLWSEDFATGFNSANGIWTPGGANSNLVTYDTDGPDSLIQFGWGPLPSPTSGNGFAIWDWYNRIPGWSFAAGPAVGTLTSPVINLGTDTNAYITIYQQMYWCCEIGWEALLEVSTDGGNTFPTQIVLNRDFNRNDRHWNLGLGYQFQFSLTDAIQADPTNVVLRFNWTAVNSDVNGQFTNAYFWMLDDIEIHRLPQHSMEFVSASDGAPEHDIIYNGVGSGTANHGIMMYDQRMPISFDSNIRNFGSETQTNARLEIEILDGSGNQVTTRQSPSATIPPGDTVTYSVFTTETTPWTPQSIGTYQVIYSAVSDSITNTAAPSDTFTIYVTDSVHSVDFNAFSNNIGSNELGDDGSAMASQLSMVNGGTTNSVALYSVDLRFSTATVAGGDVVIEVYDTTGFSFTNGFGAPPLVSESYTVTSTMPGTLTNFDLRDNNGVPVTLPAPGTYFFVVYMYSNGGTNAIQLANDQTFEESENIMYDVDAGRWWAGYSGSRTFNAPWIRAHIAEGIGLEERSVVNFTAYPNPSKGKVNVAIEEGGKYNLEVVNMAGQSVYSESVEVNGNYVHEMNLSHLAKGVYVLNVNGDKGNKATKITIE